MTQLLQQAMAELFKLPAPEQDAMASLLLAELQSERRWANAFQTSLSELEQLAGDALAEFGAGETRPLDLDRDFPHD